MPLSAGPGISTQRIVRCGNQDKATVSSGVPWSPIACWCRQAQSGLTTHALTHTAKSVGRAVQYPAYWMITLDTLRLSPPFFAGAQDQLCRYGIEPHPGPLLRIGSWNACGLTQDKRVFMRHLVEVENIDILLVQELKWGAQEAHTLEGWSCLARPRTTGGGGVAVFARQGLLMRSLPFAVPAVWATSLEGQLIEVSCEGENISLMNLYCPPGRDFAQDVLVARVSALESSLVVAGDFNGHHAIWDDNGEPDERGSSIADWIVDCGLQCCNDPSQPTREVRDRRTSPDIFLVRSAVGYDWKTLPTVHSDHNVMCLTVHYGVSPDRPRVRPSRALYSWEKADWKKFGEVLDRELAGSDNQPHCLARKLATALSTAAKKAIPRGAFAVPQAIWSAEVESALNKCLHLRTAALAGQPALWKDFYDARTEYTNMLRQLTKAAFTRRCNEAQATDSSAWAFLNKLKTPPRAAPAPVVHQGRPLNTARQKADHFLRAYAKVSRRHPTASPLKRIHARGPPLPRVTPAELKAAISRLALRKAPGLDGVHAEFLRHLTPTALRYLHRMVNISVTTGYVPRSWRTGVIIPLLKPGKSATEAASYRPVTLTSVLCKLTEGIILRRMKRFLDPTLTDTQSGFREGRSTADQVVKLMDYVHKAFNLRSKSTGGNTASHRVAAVFVDLSKAFDTVSHDRLLALLKSRGLPHGYLRWIRNFLQGRTCCVRVDTTHSRNAAFTAGVPQGSILGPYLFCIYADELARRLQALRNRDFTTSHLDHGFFADDLTLYVHGPTVQDCKVPLQRALNVVQKWCEEYHMIPNADKTEYVVFTRATRSESDDDGITLTLSGRPISRAAYREIRDVRLLGIRLDARLAMTAHQDYLRGVAGKRLAQLAALSGSDFGPSPHELRSFLFGHVLSIVLYASEAWWSMMSDTNREHLEICHLRGARSVTGLYKPTVREDVLREAHLPWLDDIVAVRSLAYYERCLRSSGDRRRVASRALRTNDKRPFVRHPRTEADSLLQKICDTFNLSLDHARAPLPTWSRYAPWDTGDAAHILIDTGITATADDPDEKRLAASLAALSRHRPVRYELWTDGSAYLDRDCPSNSASAGAFTLYDNDSVMFQNAEAAGKLGCSYRAECVAMRLAAQYLLRNATTFAGHRVLIVTDSLSLLEALKPGPCASHGDIENEIWDLFLQLGRARVKMTCQFVLSHCGLERNDDVDACAKAALRLPQDQAQIWLPDLLAAAKALRRRASSLATLETPRSRVVGTTSTSKVQLSCPRPLFVFLARLRVGESSFIGRYRKRIGITTTSRCRWCSPQQPVPQILQNEQFHLPPPEEQPAARGRALAPHTCPRCDIVCSNRGNLQQHLIVAHPEADAVRESGTRARTAPPQPRQQAEIEESLTCPHCRRVLKSATWRTRHMQKCCPNLLNGPAPPQEPEPEEIEQGEEETVEHVVLHCPALSGTRAPFDIKSDDPTIWFDSKLKAFVLAAKAKLEE